MFATWQMGTSLTAPAATFSTAGETPAAPWRGITTAAMPTAAAVRISAPRLCGSCTWSSTSTGPRRPRQDRRAGRGSGTDRPAPQPLGGVSLPVKRCSVAWSASWTAMPARSAACASCARRGESPRRRCTRGWTRLHLEPARDGVDPVEPARALARRSSARAFTTFRLFTTHPHSVKILDRYILRELLVPFVLGLAVFTSILLIVRILKLVEMVVNRGVPLVQILKLFSYILPAFLEVTVPMALLLAILVAFGRLSSDSEIVALRAAGISLYRLLRPVGGFAVVIAALTLGLSMYARPWGNSCCAPACTRSSSTRAERRHQAEDLQRRVHRAGHLRRPHRAGHATTLRGHPDLRHPRAAQHNTVYAETGRLFSNEDAPYAHPAPRRTAASTRRQRRARATRTPASATYDITLDLDTALAQLRDRAQGRQRDDAARAARRDRRQGRARASAAFVERVEVQRKFSIPFACLVFAALGVPLGIQPSRSVHSRGFSVSLVLIFVYYLLLTFGQNLGERGALPAAGRGVAAERRAVASSPRSCWRAPRARPAADAPALWDRLAAARAAAHCAGAAPRRADRWRLDAPRRCRSSTATWSAQFLGALRADPRRLRAAVRHRRLLRPARHPAAQPRQRRRGGALLPLQDPAHGHADHAAGSDHGGAAQPSACWRAATRSSRCAPAASAWCRPPIPLLGAGRR